MSQINPIDGVDYIFDRYAFLGLSPDATKEEIQAAIKIKRAENHPDRIGKTGDEIQKTAEQQRILADQAEIVLLNDDIRPIYDATLQQFKDQYPHLVSNDGHAIIDLGHQKIRVDLDSILGEAPGDSVEIKQSLAQQVGYDPAQLAKAERLYQKLPDDSDAQDLYRDALMTKHLYLTVVEDDAWYQAGVQGEFAFDSRQHYGADDYAEFVQQRIAGVIDDKIPPRGCAALSSNHVGHGKIALIAGWGR